jgi:hypothetical protein
MKFVTHSKSAKITATATAAETTARATGIVYEDNHRDPQSRSGDKLVSLCIHGHGHDHGHGHGVFILATYQKFILDDRFTA